MLTENEGSSYCLRRFINLSGSRLLTPTLLLLCSPLGEEGCPDESTLVQCGSTEMSTEEQELLKLYHHSFDDERVDLDLIMDLLHNICSTTGDGEPSHWIFEQHSCLLSSVIDPVAW